MNLPRVLVVPYLRDWTYDMTAQALVRHLSHRFDFRIAYREDIEAHHLAAIEETPSALLEWGPDVVIDLWWHGTLHLEFGRKTMKQISSHRWATSEKFGKCSPAKLLARYADDVGAIAVPSHRLRDLLTPLAGDRPVMVCPKGFEPADFYQRADRTRGDHITFGWSGASEAADKHLALLREACPDLKVADHSAPELRRPYSEMPAFYNSIDVIMIASEAEGDPRPLIEAMACGAFVISTDVGIVPQLVQHGVNGLIVERTVEAFARGVQWCRGNPLTVCELGAYNARVMRGFRTWEKVMPQWGAAIDRTIERARGLATSSAEAIDSASPA